MSIFTKTCPRCAADSAADAPRCGCGYVFENDARTNSYAAIELALQEAQLYSDYLKARLQQAREAAEVAAADAERSPDDEDKARLAKEARSEYKCTKTEYKLQLEQIVQLENEARIRQQQEAAAAQKNAWQQAKKKAAQKAVSAKPAPPQPVAEAHKAKPQPVAQTQKAKPPVTTPAPQASVRPSATLQQKLAQKAHQAIARAKEAAAPAKRVPPPRPTPPAARPAVIAKPVMDAAAGDIGTKPAKAAPVAPAAQKPRPKTIECPHCTATLPLGTQKCRCGYVFAETTDAMPSIGLTSEEQAQLLNLFRPEK